MNEFWDSRYSEKGYAYGTEPNEFFRQELGRLSKGKILFPAEGEGRNAVYAARKGFDVYAFDFSNEGKKKALNLANQYGVDIRYQVDTFDSALFPDEYFDVIVLVFAHMPPHKRQQWHRKVAGLLKPGGTLILEGFSKDQLQFGSGGPPTIEMLFSTDELRKDFTDLQVVSLDKKIVQLNEGPYHQGDASVIRGVFRK